VTASGVSSPRQRRTRREICDVLRSDLYQRTGSGEASAIWTSPLKWQVEYGNNPDGETMWCEITGPDGALWRRSEDADANWLNAELP
jgi:hypothetical protein